MADNIIIINTDGLTAPSAGNGIWENRANNYFQYELEGVPTCSILVQGYNRLNKTKYAVECVLKYTQDVDYELILVDNGSDDGTFEYFKSIEHENKTIIRVTNNIGSGFPFETVKKIYKGKYLAAVSNDVYVTKNWLSNIIKCYESDPRIGYACPASSNVSNFQEIEFEFSSFEDMQQKAALYNKSDPSKWEERMRAISILSVWARPVLDIVGSFDPAYIHDFGEDDMAIRLRRAGYKIMVLKDTWICHDHDFRNAEDKDPIAFQKSIESGRAVYREKYHGIDPWDDVNNYELILLDSLNDINLPDGTIRSLCVDVKCGTPILEIRNVLRRQGITDVESFAFTAQAKYYLDLKTTDAKVECDRIDYIQSKYADNTFDIIVLGEPLNTYNEPVTLLQRLYNFLKPGGILLFKLRNTDDYKTFLRTVGLITQSDPDMPACISPEDILNVLKLFGGKDILINIEPYNLSKDDVAYLTGRLNQISQSGIDEEIMRLCAENFAFKVVKG